LVRLFKNKWFARFASAENIDDATLCKAIADAEKGLIDADLGGGVIKQRIARAGEGASGGFRSIVLYRQGKLAFFVFGFPKNRTANIKKDELRAFTKLAKEMLALDDRQIARLTKTKALIEVICHG
jgi:hypothetical protein